MRLRWVALGVALLLVVAVGGALIFANRFIEANRDRILSAAEQAIGRPVQIGALGARLLGRPGLWVTDFSIADDPAFGSEPFATAHEATVVLKLWPLLEGRLEIGRIELQQPAVRVVRAADGRFNYASLGPVTVVAPATAPVAAPAAAPASTSGAGLAWAVALFDIDDGGVDFIDRTATPPRTTSAQKIALRASDIALNQAIHFSLRAAVDAPDENVDLSGEFGPIESPDGVPFSVGGSVGPWTKMPLTFTDIVARGWARPQSIDLDEIKLSAFGGEVSGQGTLPLIESGPFSFNGKGSGIELEQLLPVVGPQVKQEIDGRASGNVELQGIGLTRDSLRQSLRGDIGMEVRDGVLRRYNLPGEVVLRLTSLPGLTQLIARGVKGKYAAVLNRPDTRFDSLVLRLRLVHDAARLESFKLTGEDFGATATGTVSLAGDADLQGEVQLSKRFSLDVASDVKEAVLLFNSDGEIAIPFRYRGKIGQAKPEADVERIATSLLGSRGGALIDQLQKKLGNLFRH